MDADLVLRPVGWLVAFSGGVVTVFALAFAFAKGHPWIWSAATSVLLLLLLTRSFFLYHKTAEDSRAAQAVMTQERRDTDARIREL